MFRDNSLDGTPYHYKRKDPGIINRPEVARVTVDLSDGPNRHAERPSVPNQCDHRG